MAIKNNRANPVYVIRREGRIPLRMVDARGWSEDQSPRCDFTQETHAGEVRDG